MPGGGLRTPQTLRVGSLSLSPTTQLIFTLGIPNVIGNCQNDLVQVDGNLTLQGTLGINATPGFGGGVYRLFNYGGILTNNGLGILFAPDGYDASDFIVQTAIPGQINLIVVDPDDEPIKVPETYPGQVPGIPTGPLYPMPGPAPDSETPNPGAPGGIFSRFQFWDGGRTTVDGTILGGSGIWNNTDATWSSIDGLSKKTWNGYRAVFGGNAGTADVQDNVSFRKIDFITDGYTIHSSNNSKLLVRDPAVIKVDSGYQADIAAEITGSGSISKKGVGTLILSHDNSYAAGTVLNEGTLVANTRNALSSGSVTLQGGILCLGNTQALQVGSYIQNQDAILVLRIKSPTNYDQLVVNGSAYLGGTLLLVGKPSNFGKQMPLITRENSD